MALICLIFSITGDINLGVRYVNDHVYNLFDNSDILGYTPLYSKFFVPPNIKHYFFQKYTFFLDIFLLLTKYYN